MNNYLMRFRKEDNRTNMHHLSINRWLKLPLFAILLFFCLPDAAAQQISLKTTGSSLENVLKTVGSQVSYVFFYKKEEIKSVGNISVNLKAVPLKQALNSILAGTDFEYEIFEKTIVVKKKVPVTRNISLSTDSGGVQRQIRGRVVDENRRPLSKITVMELATDKETKTNAKGEFSLRVQQKGSLAFVGEGFANYVVEFTDSTTFLTAIMETEGIALNSVNVSGDMQKKEPGRFVDMKNRNYMNLAQVLQGTVPGLSLQIVSTSNKEVTSVEAFVYRDAQNNTVNNFVRFSVEEFLSREGKAKGQAIIDQLLSGKNVPASISKFYRLNTTSRTSSALVPQVRGANNFINNGSTMLVVIDGFPQDGFPADFPMTNVESIEVVKDQAELVKWGSRANGGVILVRTKSAKKGKIQVTYSSNFYFTPAVKFSREKLQMATTADYLDYVRVQDSVFGGQYRTGSFNYTPAKRLFAQKRQGLITDVVYNRTLDSLKSLDNESQMNMLQQDAFSQNHTLGLNGGTNTYKFNLIGNYFGNQLNDIKTYDKAVSFNLNNDISLLKNKLKINWLINYSNQLSRRGYSFSPASALEPYQMLLDNNGNYVYDYTVLSPSANAILMANGYKNYGLNVLEDANTNRNLSRIIQKRTRFNLRWNLLEGLNLTSAVYYNGTNNRTSNFYGKESSYVRRLVDNYGTFASNGINWTVPYGDILQQNLRTAEEWNVRSNLNYTKIIGKHQISMAVGAGAANVGSKRPNNATLYGYNAETKTGSPVFLNATNIGGSISNYGVLLPEGATTVNPYILTQPQSGDTTLARNVNANASLEYKYSDRVTISGLYSSVYNPLYGQNTNYSVSKNYKADVTGMVLKDIGKVLQNVYLSTGVEGVRMPDLAAYYSNFRYQQALWNNYTIVVNGLLPTQQKGQSSNTYYQRLTFSLLDSMFVLNAAHNTQKIVGNFSVLAADPTSTAENSSTTTNYISAGISSSMRKGLLHFQMDYSKSPEGTSQINGSGGYDIAHENYLTSNIISMLDFGFKIQNISSFQGLSLMMGTNVASNGSFTQATNSDFSLLPPRNTNYEIYGRFGIYEDKHTIDVRYYDQSTSGLNNYTPVLTDPTTGVKSRVTYSRIKNSGVELYLKTQLVKRGDFLYNLILNGAYNKSIATDVPLTPFNGEDSYARAYVSGYSTNALFSVQSGGLNGNGDPQIYDGQGRLTSVLDSASITSSMIYSGVTRAPWTGGLIHEFEYKSFFARTSLIFSLGHVMRELIPYPNISSETSAAIKNRWRQPGDEAFTNVPRITSDLGNSFRSFVTRNGTNSVTSASNIRLQEIVLGCNLPAKLTSKLGISSATVTLQAQNILTWYHNSIGVDPTIVGGDGRIGTAIPRQYSCNITIGF